MRRLPYCEGTWFAVPLVGGGFGVGVVARMVARGRIILVYLFGPKRAAVPALKDVEKLAAGDAVLKLRVGDLALIRAEWPIIGHSECWRRSEWPMPVFIRREPLARRRVWLVYYSDDDPSTPVAEEPAPHDIAGLVEDGLAGAGFAESILTETLAARGGKEI